MIWVPWWAKWLKHWAADQSLGTRQNLVLSIVSRDDMGSLVGQVIKVLGCRPRGPRFQPHWQQ